MNDEYFVTIMGFSGIMLVAYKPKEANEFKTSFQFVQLVMCIVVNSVDIPVLDAKVSIMSSQVFLGQH